MKKSVIDILEKLAKSVVAMDEEKAARLSEEAIAAGIDPYLAISKGLASGMMVMGERYQASTCYVPEVMLASDAMRAGIKALRPYLNPEKSFSPLSRFRIVIGVTEGDTHDIGKNMVKVMMEASGFRMIDLGRDVPALRFVERAVAEKADMICLSSMMSTTMLGMGDVIKALAEEGVRGRLKVMVGGACVSAAFARHIGADGYASNAATAVKKARLLLRDSKTGVR